MKFLRRTLGVVVMIAGILGLALSLAGLVGVWSVKPAVTGAASTFIQTLEASIGTSQQAMEVTGQALGATMDSVDALSTMLSTTADSLEDTQPVLAQVNVMMGETVPSTLEAATESLKTAQQAAEVLDGAIKSLDTFRFVLSAVPLIGAFVEPPKQAYNPEVPLADSLGELAANLETLPATFTDMSVSLAKADDNLDSIKSSLVTMSSSVGLISKSLGDYQTMIDQSNTSMDNLQQVLTSAKANLPNVLNGIAIVFSLFFLWLLIVQVVVFSQGWELYQGTAGRMESIEATQTASEG